MNHFRAAPLALAATLPLFTPTRADACGCFAPPSPAEPVVQAGERILFAAEDGKITAHIQIQYAGSAAEFAWLVPLPSVPTLKLGSDDVFNELEKATAPTFLFDNSGTFCGGGGGGFGFGCGSEDSLSVTERAPNGPQGPVAVVVSSVGPYDYAVVKADTKQPMVDWLNANRFFVPAGADAAMEPYLHPGAYFLALKLRSGQSSGDLVPVVLEYESDLPMVPLILTSVGSVPNLGVLVWVLGQHRAVPRNYQHVVLNPEKIDWANQARNYAEVVGQAIDEADEHHAFITEFAGKSEVMVGIFDAPDRFPIRSELEGVARAYNYFVQLYTHDKMNWRQLQPIIQRHFGEPEALPTVDDRETFFQNVYAYAETSAGIAAYDPVALTAEIWERIVEPSLEVARLFRELPKLTRLYTVLSPEEMTEDPVFGFNADLPDVPKDQVAYLDRDCEDPDAPNHLTLADGRVIEVPVSQDRAGAIAAAPAAARVEVLGMEGAPQLVRSNIVAEVPADAGGCRSNRTRNDGAADLMLILLGVGGFRAVTQRRRSRSRG